MRTSIILILIALICFVFTSCEQAPNPSNSTTVSSNNNQSINSVQSEKPTINITDYDEYCKYVDSAKLPESFIHYSQIEKLGEFKGFVSSSSHPGEGVYFLTDANGFEFSLYFDPISNLSADSSQNLIQLPTVSSDDLRYYFDESSGSIFIDDFEYKYLNGNLHTIVWNTDSSILTLFSSDMLSNYPTECEHDTFVGKMLVKSEVQNALNELPDSVYQKSAK